MMSEASIPDPEALGLLVADVIYRDSISGKTSVLGIFSEIRAKSFPAVHPALCVLATLTNGRGTTPVSLRLVDVANEDEAVGEATVEVVFEDPLQVVEPIFIIGNLPFSHAGEYRLQILANGHVLLERRIMLVEVGEQ